MGSYLTIVNDTPDPWLCKVGPDLAAVTWAGIATVVLAIVSGVVSVGAGFNPLILTTIALGITYAVHHVPATSMAQHIAENPPGVVVGDSPTKIGVIISETIKKELQKEHFWLINPGTKERYGKMTLSLWRQSDCKKISTSGANVAIQTVMMRPIFSGSIDGSNRNHSINYWLNKKGNKIEMITLSTNPPSEHDKRVLAEDDTIYISSQ